MRMGGLEESVRLYPNCRIAACECNENGDEWVAGCTCFGHFFSMDDTFGKEGWNLDDWRASTQAGKPTRAKEEKK